MLAFEKKSVIISAVWQRSSVVEQRNHNPLVGGPNPSAATRINKRPDGSFFYSVRRDEGLPAGGPTRRQKADGSMPVPRSFNEGGFAKGNEAQRNQSLRCYQQPNRPIGRCFLSCILLNFVKVFLHFIRTFIMAIMCKNMVYCWIFISTPTERIRMLLDAHITFPFAPITSYRLL